MPTALRRLARLALTLALLGALLLLALHPRPLHLTPGPFRNAAALSWWIVNTPLCAGPLCINIFADHANLELHWAG